MCGVWRDTILGQESILIFIPPYTEYSTDITDVTDCTLERYIAEVMGSNPVQA